MQISLEPLAWVQNERSAIQDDHWSEVESRLVLDDCLPDEAFEEIESFSHVHVVFWFHKVPDEKIVRGSRHPRNQQHWPKVGILAQRGKNRPNRIGLCVARVLRREGRTLVVAGLDAIDGTPILDIKPVMQEFLPREEVSQPAWSTELMKQYW